MATYVDTHSKMVTSMIVYAPALYWAHRSAAAICWELDLRMVGILDIKSVIELMPREDRLAIPKEQRYDFIDRGIVIEAVTDCDSDTHYVAVAPAISAGKRAADTALRNADLLTRFTGKPAYAVVAANRINDYVKDLAESGKVLWWEITDENLDFH